MGMGVNPDGGVGHCLKIGFFSHFYNESTFVLNQMFDVHLFGTWP
jgi:hypothetical protein